MPSTAIGKIGYDPARHEMTIDFVTNGRRYVYFDVPAEAYHAFRHAFAKGVHFNRHIRDRYRSELLYDPRAAEPEPAPAPLFRP